MPRYKLKICYDGTGYHGFQRQSTGPTVQKAIEEALLPFEGAPISIFGASRTDSGVHAKGQVAHFDLSTPRSTEGLLKGLNSRLAKDIRILEVVECSPTFHARFDAKRKIYSYRLTLTPWQSPFLRFNALHYPYSLNMDQIDVAIQILKGRHDFLSFSNTTSPNDRPPCTIKEIFDIKYEKRDEMLTFLFEGDGFLYNMVRNLMGALIEVGKNKLSIDDLISILKNKPMPRKFTTMPAHPLCLDEIFYD
jgi:tRNA pseudouridine38-40 synthase